MKKKQYIFFLLIVFSIYFLINLYIFIRGKQAIPHESVLRPVYFILFTIFSLSYISGRFLERIRLSSYSFSLTWIGSFWLAAMVYFLLILLFLDIIRFVNQLIGFFPQFISNNYPKTKMILFFSSICLVFILISGGYINALHPRIKKITLTINKKVKKRITLNLVAISDIHLGTIIGPNRLGKLIKKINELNPDLVLLAGDIVDEDLGPVIHFNLGEQFKNIKSQLGIYAITGNHEYIGGVNQATRYLSDHRINILRDDITLVDEEIYIAGREDRDRKRFTGNKRATLESILSGIDRSKPIILLDHQPFNLIEAEKYQVDLQISGHTHNGQFWPFSLITRKIYELSQGYKKKGNTHFYISSGFGTWGPPVRIGTRPEIVQITLIFKGLVTVPLS